MVLDVAGRIRASAQNRQTQFLQGTSVAMLPRFDFGRVPARKIVVHFVGHPLGLLPQFHSQVHPFASPGLSVENSAPRNIADKHFLQCHGLGTQLQPVCIVYFGRAVLIFHGQGQPKPGVSLKRYPIRVSVQLHHIASTGQPQTMAYHLQPAHRQQIPAFFMEGIRMATRMQQMPFSRSQIFCPLLLHISQRPLSPTEAKVLNTGHLQIIVSIRHRLQRPDQAARRR